MTDHQVNDLATSFMAMATAVADLPKVKHELEVAEGRIFTLNESMDILKSDLEQSRSYAASLEQKVRDAEVAKDQAETMFLELDDKCSKLYSQAVGVQAFVNELVAGLDQTKVEPLKPEPLPEPIPTVVENGVMTMSPAIHEAHFEAGVQGQSEPLPTSHVTLETSALGSSAESLVADNTDSWATPTSTDNPPAHPAPPYLNRRYIDVPGWISREDWLFGGGTEADYYYRS